MRPGVFALVLAATPCLACAHPMDEVVQGAYLTLAPGEVRLELDLAPGPLVAGGMLRALDANGDRRISDAEARVYAQAVLKQSSLTLDGTAAAWRLEKVSAPPYGNLETASDTVKIYAVAKRAERAGPRTIAYENRYAPAKSQCIANVFLQPGGGWRYQVTSQQRGPDGRRLAVSYTGARA